MRSQLVSLALVAAVVCTGDIFAQTLPPPRVLPPEQRPAQPTLPPAGGATLFVMPPPGRPLYPPPLPPGYRPSAYQVWQYYGLTYQGWLRPRVIQANGSSGYYLYNGYPFPVNVYPGHHFTPQAGNAASMVPPVLR
ncbi:MAG TPA: hypothetical protein VH575_07530 [Gemmataceae bacterium]|jgi:hypothetical protein